MENENSSQNNVKKYTMMVLGFVVSIMVFGVSFSYAYYTANFKGEKEVQEKQTANLNVTSTLDKAQAITKTDLALIEKEEYKTKTTPVTFTVKNNDTQTTETDGSKKEASTVNAKYTISIVNMELTKNLFSKYFKWALEITSEDQEIKTITGDFADSSKATEGTKLEITKNDDGSRSVNDDQKMTNLTKELITADNAIALPIGKEHTIKFYMWLENDPNTDQLYLTDGSFSGNLSIDAVATRDTE